MVVWVAAGGRGTLAGAVLGAIGVNWIQSWLTTSYPDLWLLFLGALFMGVVLFFPDGVIGAIQRLAYVWRPPSPVNDRTARRLGQGDAGRAASASGPPPAERAAQQP
jgi:urea transport system permease protein